MPFRFIGAPMITEPIEFGHKAFPVYTTMRDLGYSFFSGMVVGAAVFVVNRWIGLLVVVVITIGLLILTQRLRKSFGNAWPWELIHRGLSVKDKQGYLGGGRRCHSSNMVPGRPTFLVGDDHAIQAIRHRTAILSPFNKHRQPTKSKSHIVRDLPALQGIRRA